MFVKRKIIPDKTELKALAKKLRKDITIKKILLWKELRNKQMLKNPPLTPPRRGTRTCTISNNTYREADFSKQFKKLSNLFLQPLKYRTAF